MDPLQNKSTSTIKITVNDIIIEEAGDRVQRVSLPKSHQQHNA
jgi:hypothetical protein